MKGLIQFYYANSYGHIRMVQKLAYAFSQNWPECQLTILNGGEPLDFELWSWPTTVSFFQLPAFTSNKSQFDGLKSIEGKSVEQVSEERIHIFKSIVEEEYNFYISDFFPFGRAPLRKEYEEELRLLKKRWPNCLTICATREVVGKKWDDDHDKKEKHKRRVNRCLEKYYDHIFVLGDDRFISDFDFPLIESNRKKISFLGYLSDSRYDSLSVATSEIVFVYAGGGRDGEEIVTASLEAAITDEGQKSDWVIVVGGFGKLPTNKTKNVKIFQSVAPDMIQVFLSKSKYIISMCGYNSFVESSNTYAAKLFCPREFEPEQQIRSGYLTHKEGIEVCPMNMINKEKILGFLKRFRDNYPYPIVDIGMDGGENFVFKVKSLL